MCSCRRLFPIVAVFGSAILLLAGAAPHLTCHASQSPSKETHSPAGQGTLEQRSSAKLIGTPDPDVEWRITDKRFVERSADGGKTWHGQELGTEADLLAGSAPSAKLCWVVGRGGAVYVTKDARNWNKVIWNKVTEPVSADLVAVFAKSARSAVVTTADGREFETHDGGKKWEPILGASKR